ncbi:MAG: DnaJ domain-containing protein [Proteobacteria bacterium]|nr:DnaJ domain-containing protein [Pseudomonadota bacterium]MBU1687856.1 DnaJ domain-containing protein [Pseudomonadota bacterium]
MQFQDYYKILGVARDASPEDVQRAYRKLARKHHPDVNKDKDAEAQFKRINEANAVLKDPEKRKLYDTYGSDWQQGGVHPPPEGNGGFEENHRQSGFSRGFRFDGGGDFADSNDFSDFFNNLFGRGFQEHTSRSAGFDMPGRTQEAELAVTLAEAYHGTTKALTLQSDEGDGLGEVRPVSKTLHVKIPKGVTNGSVIRLAGQGEKGHGQGVGGDLLLRINIAPDDRFKVHGHDLSTVVAVSPWEAALGSRIPVRTLDGTVTLAVPSGTQNHKKFRLRGKGIPKRSGGSGDIFVEIEVRVPERLSGDEERLLKELAEKSPFNPRDKFQQRAA